MSGFFKRRWVKRLGLGLLAVILVGPFLIPVETSGTLTYRAAAGDFWKGQSSWVEVAGHEVHYVTAGDASSERVVILLHGFGASAYSYKEVMPLISADAFVIAYDRAAFGFTERPTTWDVNPYGTEGQLQVLDALISKFGSGRQVVVVGHSAGGNIAARYAIENPDALDGLVLFAPAVLTSGGSPEWLNWVYSIPQLDHVGPLLVGQIATAGLDILYSSYYDQSKVTAEVLAGYTAPLKIAGWERAFWEFNRAPRGDSIADKLSDISVPTLVITGDNDGIVPTSDSVEVAARIPGSDLVVIPKSGHLPNEEVPSEFAKALNKFLYEGVFTP